jgi:hypothetical protein
MSNLTLTNGKTTSNGGAIFDWTHDPYYYYYNGGAIHNRGNLTIINCNFTSNTAFNNGAGGAIYNDANLNVTGSSFINNGANKGGAIYNCANANVTFSRLSGNSAYQGNSIYNWIGTTDAQLNWWGSNAGPSGTVGTVNTGAWLILKITADTTIEYGETSDITVSMLNDSNGIYHNPSNGCLYNIPVALTGTKGTLSPSSAKTVNGIVQSVFTATSGGDAVINAIVDGQAVSIGIAVNPTYSTLTSVNNFKGQNVTLIVQVVDSDHNSVNEGQVTFKVNGTIVRTVNVTSGQGKLNWTIPLNWNAGTYNITANYSATNYASSNSSAMLTVDKTPTILTLNNVSSFHNQYVNIIANLTDYYGNALGGRTVNFTINGDPTTYTATTLANGLATINYQIIQDTNSYSISSSFSGDSNHLSSTSNIGNLNVSKTPTNTTVNSLNNFSGQNVTLAAQVLDYYNQPVPNGQVRFTIGNATPVTVNVVSGIATTIWTIPYSWTAGNYNIVAEYLGTNNLTVSNAVGTLTADKIPTNLTLSNVSNFWHQYVDIVATLTDYYGAPLAGKNITITLNGDSVTYNLTTNSSGSATLNYQINQDSGNYSVSGLFNGDSNYLPTSNLANLNVIKTPTSISIDTVNNFSGQTVTLIAHIVDYYNQTVKSGQVRFTVGNTTPVTVNVVSGLATLNGTIPLSWAVGNYNITAEYLGTSNLTVSNATGTLNVDRTPVNVTVEAGNNFYHQYVDIIANITDYYGNPLVNKLVTFQIDGDSSNYTANTDSNGLAALQYQIVQNVGNYNIKAMFGGDVDYLNSTNNGTLAVTKTPAQLTMNNITSFPGQSVNLTASVFDYYNSTLDDGLVTFKVNGTIAGTTNVSSGVAILSNWQISSSWDAGNYEITAEYTENNDYLSNSTNSTLIANLIPTSITIDPLTGYKSANVTLSAKIVNLVNYISLQGKSIDFYVNGTKVGSGLVNEDGIATYNYHILENIGTYDITAIFSEDSQFTASNNTNTLTVDPTLTNVTMNPISGYRGDNIPLNAKLWDLIFDIPVNGRTIDFFINGTNVGSNTTDINGIATFSYTIVENIGDYVLSTVFNGDEQFGASNGTTILSVNATPTTIVIENVTTNKGQNVVLNATLWDTYRNQTIAGQNITFKVNGAVIGSVITDTNGTAILNYTVDLIGGKYPIETEFAGDTQYANSSAIGTLKVLSANLYIQVKTSKNNPKLGKKFTLTYKLGNKGPDSANNVIVTIFMPKGFQITGITGDGNWTYNQYNNTITWTLKTVEVGDPYLYITGKNTNTGNHIFASSISSETYNSNTEGVTSIKIVTPTNKNNHHTNTVTVKAATQINTANATTGNATDNQNTTNTTSDSNSTTAEKTPVNWLSYWWILILLILVAGGYWYLLANNKGE